MNVQVDRLYRADGRLRRGYGLDQARIVIPDIADARDTGSSFATVWRRAEDAGIELTAGREAKG